MDYSTPDLPAPHHLQEFTQVHVYYISDALQLILCCPFLLLSSAFPSIRSCQNLQAASLSVNGISSTIGPHKYDLSGRAAWTDYRVFCSVS